MPNLSRLLVHLCVQYRKTVLRAKAPSSQSCIFPCHFCLGFFSFIKQDNKGGFKDNHLLRADAKNCIEKEHKIINNTSKVHY